MTWQNKIPAFHTKSLIILLGQSKKPSRVKQNWQVRTHHAWLAILYTQILLNTAVDNVIITLRASIYLLLPAGQHDSLRFVFNISCEMMIYFPLLFFIMSEAPPSRIKTLWQYPQFEMYWRSHDQTWKKALPAQPQVAKILDSCGSVYHKRYY